jgi:cytochrome b
MNTTASDMVRVWDPVVRIGHWILVATFFTAYFTEDDLMTVHAWAGYLLAGVVAFRLLWGFAGSRHARFSDFSFSPATTTSYLVDMLHQRARRYIGHNPAGAAMIFALLVCLTVTAVSGMGLYAVEDGAGPLAGLLPRGDDDVWEEVHEVFANLTLGLIVLHVGGVLYASREHGENLIRSMLTGRKRA